MSATTFIYALTDPRTGAIRYIGKSNDPNARLKSHIGRRSHNPFLNAWIDDMRSAGMVPSLAILQKVDYTHWRLAERNSIAAHLAAGQSLLNLVAGGNGPPTVPWNYGRTRLTDSRIAGYAEKIAQRQRGNKASDATKVRMSIAHKILFDNPDYREANRLQLRTAYDENRATIATKISSALSGRIRSPEHCAAISAAHKGKKIGSYRPHSKPGRRIAWTIWRMRREFEGVG